MPAARNPRLQAAQATQDASTASTVSVRPGRGIALPASAQAAVRAATAAATVPSSTPSSNVVPIGRLAGRRSAQYLRNRLTRLGGLTAPAIALSRHEFEVRAGLTYKGNRNLDRALGRLETIDVGNYQHRYQRGDIAGAIIDKIVDVALRSGADIFDNEDEKPTSWSDELESLFSRLRVWDVLREAFIACRKASYSIIVIGTKLDKQANETFASPLTRVPNADSVVYLRTFGELDITRPTKSDLIQDESSPLYGYPEFYKIDTTTTGAGVSTKVHYTRVIHISDSLGPWGKPVLERIWDRLDDLDKMVGGGSEGTFQNIQRGAWNVDPSVEFESSETGSDGDKDYDETSGYYEDAIAAWRHGLLDDLVLQGLSAVDIKTKIPDISPNAKLVMRLIAAATGYPERVLFGTEEGKLAGEQDSASFADSVRGYRNGFCERHLRALVDRLQTINALRKVPSYTVNWSTAERLSPVEKSEVAKNLTQANLFQMRAEGRTVADAEEIRRDVLDMQPREDEGDNSGAGNGSGSAAGGGADVSVSVRASIDDNAPDEVVALDTIITNLEQDAITVIDNAIADAIAVVDDSSIDVNAIVDILGDTFGDAIGEVITEAINTSAVSSLALAKSRGTFLRNASQSSSTSTNRNLQIEIEFDTANPRAVDFAARYATDLTNDLTDDARRMLNSVISTSTELGYTTRQTAALISNSIGITGHEIGHVTTLLRNMANANVGTTVRYGTTRKVIIDGTQAQIDRTVRSYTSHLLQVRKRRLARTLLARSANEGLNELWLQARDAGQLPSNVVRVYLKNTERHADRDGQTVPLGERFEVEPGEDANCGCSQGLDTV